MNLYLHGIDADPCPVYSCVDSLAAHRGKHFSVVPTNPPFGKKRSIAIEEEKVSGTNGTVECGNRRQGVARPAVRLRRAEKEGRRRSAQTAPADIRWIFADASVSPRVFDVALRTLLGLRCATSQRPSL